MTWSCTYSAFPGCNRPHRLMDKAFLYGFHTHNKFHTACRSQQMTNHRFRRVNNYLIRRLPKTYYGALRNNMILYVLWSLMWSLCLKEIVVMGTGPVSIDIIHLRRRNPCLAYGKLHRLCRSASIFAGRCICNRCSCGKEYRLCSQQFPGLWGA